MPLNAKNQRTFHRRLYSGILQSVLLLKRNNDQQEGTVTSYRLFQVRWSMLHKSGQPIQGDMSVGSNRSAHIPRCELDRVGVWYINALDRLVDKQGRYWQPESDSEITVKLFEDHICVDCKRVDPPA